MVIVHEINSLKMIGIDVMKHIRTKLGSGDKTMFWDDKWCAGDSLKDRFSRMYALESSKQITVGLKLSHPNLSSSFRRYPRGGIEMEQFVKMENAVNKINLTTTDDRWVWDLKSTGLFSVSSIRNLIDEKTLPVTYFKTIWNKFGVETSSHIFFSCSLARSLVNHITCWWSLPDIELDSNEDWINWTIFDAKIPKKALLLDDGL
nr:RNA-directed DNA polymerase, eukaryota, reverse transcriptase zinc-binding domain protein [Tanacetum cinerariifolium]